GLLVPADRSQAGYRLYCESDLERLTRILYYRELGFGLDEIATLLDDNDVGARLRHQHKLLTEQMHRIQAMVAALVKEMEATMSGHQLTAEEKLEIFGDAYDPDWEDEARQRWGSTEAWQQSQQRTASFTKADWQQVKADDDAFNADLAATFQSGAAPDSPQALALAERHRQMIERFYDRSYAMHRGLAEMYLADERFTAYFEDRATGLAQWFHDAIHANAEQHPDAQG